jgi:hypothetical protein
MERTQLFDLTGELKLYPFNAFRSLLGIASGAGAPNFAALYSGDWVHPTCSRCLR